MNETQIKALRAHAGKLVAEGKLCNRVFEYLSSGGLWLPFSPLGLCVPNFEDGNEWRIAKPKKQIIDWSHPYFKGCATNYGELGVATNGGYATLSFDNYVRHGGEIKGLRLAKPANDHANWQPFFSTPENDAKLRELAKMVKVEVRYFSRAMQIYTTQWLHKTIAPFADISNYRITGECQDGWTYNPMEAQS